MLSSILFWIYFACWDSPVEMSFGYMDSQLKGEPGIKIWEWYIYDESDRLGSDCLGNHVDWRGKKEAWGPSSGAHEYFGYGKRKKKGRRLKQRKLSNCWGSLPQQPEKEASTGKCWEEIKWDNNCWFGNKEVIWKSCCFCLFVSLFLSCRIIETKIRWGSGDNDSEG